MKKIRKIAFVIIGLFLLMIWSGIIRNVTLGQKTMGPLTQPIKSFSEVISNMKSAYKHFLVAPEYYLKTKEKDLSTINNLTYDVYGLYSFRKGQGFRVELQNFKNKEIISTWEVRVDMLSKYYNVGQNDRLFPAKLMGNRELIIACDEKPGLIRLDSLSNLIWFNKDYIFHHGMNFDEKGNIWTPGVQHEDGIIVPKTLDVDGTKVDYRDDLVLNIDAITGKTIYSKSLTDIFIENDLSEIINKGTVITDPFHLNDVEPVLRDTSDYFRKGDLFLSFRHLSSIIQFRPSTGKVISVLDGPFTYQHDVDIISDNSIALFNNNTVVKENNFNKFEFKPGNQAVQRKIAHSNVLIYNFETNTYEAIYENAFVKNGIFTDAEGLFEFLPNGDLFVEEQNPGILWIVNDTGVVLKTTIQSEIDGYHYLPNWTSIYMNINY